MLPFAINISTIFQEYPFLERFKKAKQAGFSLVECQFPYDFTIEQVQQELINHDLEMALINFPPGDWKKGERGIAIYPDRIDEFRQSVETGIAYARALGTKKVHCMAGVLSPEMDRSLAKKTFIENIRYAATELAKHEITVLIEPINRIDNPGYFLADLGEAIEIIEEIAMPNVKLQFDFYHIQMIHGDVLSRFKRHQEVISHVQIADVPGRRQPGTGEMDYEQILAAIKEWNDHGVVGLEYLPLAASELSFEWMTLS